MIQIKELNHQPFTDISQLLHESEVRFARTALEIPGLRLRHEPVKISNREFPSIGVTVPDFIVTNQSGSVGAVVEVTVSFLSAENKQMQIKKCGCWLGERDEEYGICVRRNRLVHDNVNLPNPLSLVVIGRPAIFDEHVIQRCIRRVVLGD